MISVAGKIFIPSSFIANASEKIRKERNDNGRKSVQNVETEKRWGSVKRAHSMGREKAGSYEQQYHLMQHLQIQRRLWLRTNDPLASFLRNLLHTHPIKK